MTNPHLRALLNEPDAPVYAAANPGLSETTLEQLYAEAANPRGNYDDTELFLNLAVNPSTGEALLLKLVRHSDESRYGENVGELLARRRDLPAELLEQLRRQNQTVVNALAGNETIPPDVLNALIGWSDSNPRQWAEDETATEAIRNPAAPAAALDVLAADARPLVRRLVVDHPNLSPKSASRLAADSDDPVRLAALAHPRAAAKLVAEAAESADGETRAAAAANPALPTGTLTVLAGDSDYKVRKAVAANPATPGGVLASLTSDVPGVTMALAANPASTTVVLRELLGWPPATGPAAPQPNCGEAGHIIIERDDIAWSEQELRTFAATDILWRHLAAKSPATPPDALEKLAADENPWIVETVAGNPATPTAALNEIAARLPHTRKARIIENLVANPNTANIIEHTLNPPAAQTPPLSTATL